MGRPEIEQKLQREQENVEIFVTKVLICRIANKLSLDNLSPYTLLSNHYHPQDILLLIGCDRADKIDKLIEESAKFCLRAVSKTAKRL